MPIKLNDAKLSTLYKSLEAAKASNPSLTIDAAKAAELVSKVADRSGLSAAKALEQLKAPTATRAQQVALVQRGMSSFEKKDLETILDSGSVPLTSDAKAFLEAIVGRNTPPPSTTGLSITGNQANGFSGTTKPGASIEAINITTAPGGRLHIDDTSVIGKADANGNFSGARLSGDQVPREGDLVRIRSRYADGTTSDWVTVKASGLEAKDTRNAVVALFRIGVADAGGGKVSVNNINEGRQISEPGAKLQFTNARTGEKSAVVLDDQGTFPAGLKLNGKPGDVFSVAATDGLNNTAFTAEVGKVTVPGGAPNTGDLIPDPKLHKDELNADGTPRFSTKRFTGPLFKDGVSPMDVAQGQLGNCYMPAGVAAVANMKPDAIQKAIKDNGDGTYTVTFKQKDWATNAYRDVPIKIDGDLYVRSWGGPLYGSAAGSDKSERGMELWYPLLEKAFATWKGSYNSIGNGGSAGDVMEAVVGRPSVYRSVSSGTEDATFAFIKKQIDAGQPVAAGTHDGDALYTNTGVYGDHAYSVLGYAERNGERYVKLRNPWGESEPAGNGPNDGVFELKIQDFTRLYAAAYSLN
jgi:hypothetical protein